MLVAVIGVGLGVLAAIRHNSPLDHAISVGTYLGISVPEFFWGIVLILVFAATLGWLPSAGSPISSGVGTWAAHVAPAATLAFALIAHVSRMTRSSMLGPAQPLRPTRRAKGLPERVVVLRHALRNALLPTITVLAIDVGLLIGGVVVAETVFAYPGLGRAADLLDASRARSADDPGEHPGDRRDLLRSPIWSPTCSTPSSTRRSAMADAATIEAPARPAPPLAHCLGPASCSSARSSSLAALAPWIAPYP